MAVRHHLVFEHRLLPDAVDPEADPVPLALSCDLDLRLLVIGKDERDGDEGLQGVALRAARRADVGFPTAGPAREVEDALDRGGRDSRTVVPDSDSVAVDLDCDLRHGPSL